MYLYNTAQYPGMTCLYLSVSFYLLLHWPVFVQYVALYLYVSNVSVQELEKFKTFVKRKPAFDVVVDGLNVANINKDKSKLSETVRKNT